MHNRASLWGEAPAPCWSITRKRKGHMRLSQWKTLLALLFGFALVAAACSGDSTGDAAQESDSPTTTEEAMEEEDSTETTEEAMEEEDAMEDLSGNHRDHLRP